MTDKQDQVVQAFNSAKDNASVAVVGAEESKDDSPLGYLSTRIPMLDYLIGQPGIPIGGITTIVGPYGSSKSTIIANLITETQERGGTAILFETEGRLSSSRATQLGVNMDDLIVVAPETMQEGFKNIQQMIEVVRDKLPPDELVFIAMDSVAGAPLAQELAGDDFGVGLHARIISGAMRVMSALVRRQMVSLVFTAQPRSNISFGGWGKAETTFIGERPLGHASKLLLNLAVAGKLGENKESPEGFKVIATVQDTRISNRRNWKRTLNLWSEGFDYAESALAVLVEIKAIAQKGGWYEYKDEKFRAGDFGAKLEQSEELRELVQYAPVLWQS